MSTGRVDVGGTVTAQDVMIATGSVPFVPPGIPIDGKTVRMRLNEQHKTENCKHIVARLCHSFLSFDSKLAYAAADHTCGHSVLLTHELTAGNSAGTAGFFFSAWHVSIVRCDIHQTLDS